MIKILDADLSDKLKRIYTSNKGAKALLDSFATRKRDVAETSVRRAAQLANMDYIEILKTLRELAQAGAGEFKVGRKGLKSRIVWEYGVRSLAAAALGEGVPIKLDLEKLSDLEEAEYAEDAANSDDATHEFLLRPAKKIRFALPSDLTKREAERLAGFIKSLPFNSDL